MMEGNEIQSLSWKKKDWLSTQERERRKKYTPTQPTMGPNYNANLRSVGYNQVTKKEILREIMKKK